MTAVLGRLRRADLERDRELRDLDRLLRERPRQRPLPAPLPLHKIGRRDDRTEARR